MLKPTSGSYHLASGTYYDLEPNDQDSPLWYPTMLVTEPAKFTFVENSTVYRVPAGLPPVFHCTVNVEVLIEVTLGVDSCGITESEDVANSVVNAIDAPSLLYAIPLMK